MFTTSMIPPERIKIAEDGKAIFMADATGDWCWCIDPHDPDAVFNAERYETWDRNPEQLTEFLIYNTVREVVYGATAKVKALAVPEETLTKILAPMEEFACSSWKWPTPDERIFLGSATLAEIVKADSGSGWNVEVSASKFSHLAHLEIITEVNWQK